MAAKKITLPVLPSRLVYIPSKSEPKGIRVRVPCSESEQPPLVHDLLFASYGSVQATLLEALALRNKHGTEQWGNNWNPAKRYDQHRESTKGTKGTKTSRNNTGVIGVVLVARGKYKAWVATWVENGVPRSRQFNFGGVRANSLTSEQAFEQAVMLRKKMETKWYKA